MADKTLNLNDIIAQQKDLAAQLANVPKEQIYLAVMDEFEKPHLKALIEHLAPLAQGLSQDDFVRQQLGGFIHICLTMPGQLKQLITKPQS